MTTSLLAAAVFCAFAMLLVFAGAASAADPFTPQGQATIKVLDAMGVESKWLAGEQMARWRTCLLGHPLADRRAGNVAWQTYAS